MFLPHSVVCSVCVCVWPLLTFFSWYLEGPFLHMYTALTVSLRKHLSYYHKLHKKLIFLFKWSLALHIVQRRSDDIPCQATPVCMSKADRHWVVSFKLLWAEITQYLTTYVWVYCIHFKIKAQVENIHFALCVGADKRFYYKILLLLLCSFIVVLSLLLHFPRSSDFPRRTEMVTSVVPSGRHFEDSGLLFL